MKDNNKIHNNNFLVNNVKIFGRSTLIGFGLVIAAMALGYIIIKLFELATKGLESASPFINFLTIGFIVSVGVFIITLLNMNIDDDYYGDL